MPNVYWNLRQIQGSRGNNKDYCLDLLKNLYEQKQAGCVWNKSLHSHLINQGFVQSAVDECIYVKGTLVFAVYVDNALLFHRDKAVIKMEIKALKGFLEMTSD